MHCAGYPCERYDRLGDKDSFITYRNVVSDLEKAKTKGIEAYLSDLDEKKQMLERLIQHYNDGKSKGFYCLAVNLLELPALREIMKRMGEEADGRDPAPKEKCKIAKTLFQAEAERVGAELKLRK